MRPSTTSASPLKKTRLANPSPLSYTLNMKTLTIRLPDSIIAQIERESQTRRVSKSDIVRERLDQRPQESAPAAGVSDILEQSWAAKVPAGPPRFRSSKKQKLAEIIRAKKLHRR
jgi:Arc/MetJ-type ribon-helix-helix transcriptional regulator